MNKLSPTSLHHISLIERDGLKLKISGTAGSITYYITPTKRAVRIYNKLARKAENNYLKELNIMTYYRAKKAYDGRTWIKIYGNGKRELTRELVSGELLTYKEVLHEDFPLHAFEKVNISKFNTYWFFGLRWEIDKGYYYYHPSK